MLRFSELSDCIMYDHEAFLLLVRLVNQHSVGKADPSHVPNALSYSIFFSFLFFSG